MGSDTPHPKGAGHDILKILDPRTEDLAAKFDMVTHGGRGVFLRVRSAPYIKGGQCFQNFGTVILMPARFDLDKTCVVGVCF